MNIAYDNLCSQSKRLNEMLDELTKKIQYYRENPHNCKVSISFTVKSNHRVGVYQTRDILRTFLSEYLDTTSTPDVGFKTPTTYVILFETSMGDIERLLPILNKAIEVHPTVCSVELKLVLPTNIRLPYVF